MALIDLSKEIDPLHRNTIWTALKKTNVEIKCIQLIKPIYRGNASYYKVRAKR